MVGTRFDCKEHSLFSAGVASAQITILHEKIEIYESADCKTLQQAGYSRSQVQKAHSHFHSSGRTQLRWIYTNAHNSCYSPPPEDDDNTGRCPIAEADEEMTPALY